MRADNDYMDHLREAVALGEYRVDAKDVAQAMLERIGARQGDRQAVMDHEGDRALTAALIGPRAA